MPARLSRSAWIPPLLALLWGLNWPAARLILASLPPFTFRWMGLGAAAVLLLAVAVAQGRRLRPPQWRGVLWGGLLNVAGFNLCTVFAQLNTTTSRAAVLTYTMPMLSALLAWAVLGQRPDRRQGGALVLGMAGIALLAWPVLQSLAEHPTQRALLGLGMPLLAASCWAAGTVAAKRWPVPGDRIVNTGWQLLVGAALGALGALASGESLPASWPPSLVALLAYHVVAASALAYVLWFMLLDSTTATVSALTTLAVPVVGVLGAMALVGERPGVLDWTGFALVLGGAAAGVVIRARV